MKTLADPLVSVIIPVHNGAAYLAETVRSALDQTWKKLEIIIVDDGSTDNSIQIARDFEADNIKIFTQQNCGASAARNKGLKEAKGEYIQFLDADDLISPDKIEAQLACLKGSSTQLAICRTVHFTHGENHSNGVNSNDWFYQDNNDSVDFLIKLYAGEDVLPNYGGMITIHSWLTHRALIEKAGLWNEKLSVDDDGEFFCRVVLASEGIKFCDKGVNFYRKFNDRMSLSAEKTLKGTESAILATDLKLGYLKKRSGDPVIDLIFARHYWWAGVMAYPQFKRLSAYCIKKAGQLGYNGEKYVGGPVGHILAGVLGWRAARLIAYYRQSLKRS